MIARCFYRHCAATCRLCSRRDSVMASDASAARDKLGIFVDRVLSCEGRGGQIGERGFGRCAIITALFAEFKKKEAVSGKERVKIKQNKRKPFPSTAEKKTDAALINHKAEPVAADESSRRAERRENKRQTATQSVDSSASWAPLGRLRSSLAIVLSLNELSPSSALLPLRVCWSFSVFSTVLNPPPARGPHWRQSHGR